MANGGVSQWIWQLAGLGMGLANMYQTGRAADLAGLGMGLADVYQTKRAADRAQDTLSRYETLDAQAYSDFSQRVGEFSQRAGEFWELQKLNTGQVNEARGALGRLAEAVVQLTDDPQSQKLHSDALSIYDAVLKGAKWSQLFPTALDDMTRARDWDVRKVRDELDQTKQFINENIPTGSGAYARMMAQAAIESANKVGETRRKWDVEIASWDRDRTKELVNSALNVAKAAKTDARAGLTAAGQMIQAMPQPQMTLPEYTEPEYTEPGGRQWQAAMEAVKSAGASRQALGRYVGTLGAKERDQQPLIQYIIRPEQQRATPTEPETIYESLPNALP